MLSTYRNGLLKRMLLTSVNNQGKEGIKNALGSSFINPSTHDQKFTLHLSRKCLGQLFLSHQSLPLPKAGEASDYPVTARGKLAPSILWESLPAAIPCGSLSLIQ